MTAYEFRKMILANEINKCKARVGMSVVDGIEKGADNDYLQTLDIVLLKLKECVDLLSQ